MQPCLELVEQSGSDVIAGAGQMDGVMADVRVPDLVSQPTESKPFPKP